MANSDQNSDLNIKRLSAQRNLYSKAKIKQHFQFICLIGLIIMLIPVQNKEIKTALSTIPLIFLFLDLIWITPLMKKQKEQSAKIQEEFDCDVLDIEWNTAKIRERVRPDILTKEALSTKDAEKENLVNWYNSDIIKSNNPYKQLYAQRTNINWNINLMEYYLKGLSIFAVLVLVIACFVIGYNDYKPLDIILLVLMPMSAFIKVMWTQICEIKSILKNLESINNQVEKLIKNSNEGNLCSNQDIREIQDQIFDFRKTNLFVPDFLFWKKREEQTKIDNQVTKQKISEIKNTKKE